MDNICSFKISFKGKEINCKNICCKLDGKLFPYCTEHQLICDQFIIRRKKLSGKK